MTCNGQDVLPYPFGPAERLDLHPRYEQLRRDEPLVRVRMPYGGLAWLATTHEDGKTVLADPRFSKSATAAGNVPRSAEVTPLSANSSILGMDPPEHSRLRRLVAKAFTGRRIAALRPRAQAIMDDLLDTMVSGIQPADLAESIVWPLPITVICELLGVPTADRSRFRIWTDNLLALSGAEQIKECLDQLEAYLAELIARKRVEPSDDLLTVLIAARDEGNRLSEQELITFGVALLVAGHETTANQLGNSVYTLLSRRELWEELATCPDLIPSAVEELLRFLPLVTSAGGARFATEDVELSGILVRAGEAVVVQADSANRDVAVFERPDEIDFSRAVNPHLSFGHGAHHCLGAALARMELQMAIATLVARLPRLRLAVPADAVPWRANHVFRGVRALPVTW